MRFVFIAVPSEEEATLNYPLNGTAINSVLNEGIQASEAMASIQSENGKRTPLSVVTVGRQ